MKAKDATRRILLAAAAIMLCAAAACFGYALFGPSNSTASDGIKISEYSTFATPATTVERNAIAATLPQPEIVADTTELQDAASADVYANAGSSAAPAAATTGTSPDVPAAINAQAGEKAPQTGSTDSIVTPSYTKDNLYIKGITIPYGPSYMTATAPTTGAGLWNGSDSTTDGTWGYFIGHNPGSFYIVSGLQPGDVVTVCDSDGNARAYTVYSVFDVPNTTTWSEVAPYVEGHGESIALQTCVENNCYRVILAK